MNSYNIEKILENFLFDGLLIYTMIIIYTVFIWYITYKTLDFFLWWTKDVFVKWEEKAKTKEEILKEEEKFKKMNRKSLILTLILTAIIAIIIFWSGNL